MGIYHKMYVQKLSNLNGSTTDLTYRLNRGAMRSYHPPKNKISFTFHISRREGMIIWHIYMNGLVYVERKKYPYYKCDLILKE